ncbi:MAG: two-component system response regulator [Desulfuromonas sp.]|nr:MAG: two-component system response regulator [Desulfuromonas sp.]
MLTEQEIKNGRVLIVDDKQDNTLLLENILLKAGYQSVLSTNDPREVLDLFVSFQPDLILLDIEMPHLSGFEVIEQIKSIFDSDYLPILILTAYHDRETRLHALRSGARDFISKPFDNEEILCRIRNLIEVTLAHHRIQNNNTLLDLEIETKTRELHETRLEIIRRLGMAAEFKDRETANHIIRMSKISKLLGVAHGMSEEEGELILNASPMHDVGKIGIPDQILMKPDKLDPVEWKTMQNHSELGFRLLDGHTSEIMNAAKEIALTHHEKWDGSGYPRRINGENIPLMGRVCAIADVFDALTSPRPYKQPWSMQEATDEIERLSGQHFDPELVETFMGVKEDVYNICRRHV